MSELLDIFKALGDETRLKILIILLGLVLLLSIILFAPNATLPNEFIVLLLFLRSALSTTS